MRLALLALLFPFFSFSQIFEPIEDKALYFQLAIEGDSIDFILADTSISVKKPVFLFCQGSQPIPLFIEFEDSSLFMAGGGISNFDLEYIKRFYHLVVISMPKTPLRIKKAELNSSFSFTQESGTPTDEFIEADYLENYVKRGSIVLEYLRKQTWVNAEKLIVAGHSQGAKIATQLAIENKKVTHLGLFSPNPFGRIDEFIRRARKDAEMGIIAWKEADAVMNENYEFYKMANNSDSLSRHPELKSWNTFSEPLVDDWLSLNIPIYLTYGTNDVSAELCDIAPLYFIRSNKENLTFKRRLGLNHNFFEFDESAKVNLNMAHWKEVMNDFVDWTLISP